MFAWSSALVPSLAMSRPCFVVMMPNRSPAPFLISVLVRICLPAGVISTALPLFRPGCHCQRVPPTVPER